MKRVFALQINSYNLASKIQTCFIYAFSISLSFTSSIMDTLVKSTTWYPADPFILKSFDQHFKNVWKVVLSKRELYFFLLSLLQYWEMLSQMTTFNQLGFQFSYFSCLKYWWKGTYKIHIYLQDPYLDEPENELSRI